MALPAGSNKAIGFLTVVEHDLHGLFGGYLLLNETGRPLEFHCTAPVKPNRAQQILYGPTLKPFLYGEQIGATLVNKPTLVPLAVLVDRPASLAARYSVGQRVVNKSARLWSRSCPVRRSTVPLAQFRARFGLRALSIAPEQMTFHAIRV